MSRPERVGQLLRQIEYETQTAFDEHTELLNLNNQLKANNAKLRELCADMWRLIDDLDATPYVTERQGNNPAVTWLDEDWSVHESCKKRIRELGIEVGA